jgi:Domain of unknown function (DUF4184)
MPYTISHVAVVVPISRLLARMRVLSAVVIGSMVPDFGYLMPIRLARFETHSLLALATFCLPVGIVSYWIFQRLMKTPLVSVLPDQVYMRWRPYSEPAPWGSPRQWLLAVCGVLGGAVVHLAWDGFTHEDGRGVRMVPELAGTLEVHDHLVTGATLLQGLSSLVGLMIVIAAVAYALRNSGHAVVAPRALTAIERRSWVLVFVIITLGFGAGFSILDRLFGNPYHRWIGIGILAVALLRALVVAAVLVSLMMQVYLRAKRRP